MSVLVLTAVALAVDLGGVTDSVERRRAAEEKTAEAERLFEEGAYAAALERLEAARALFPSARLSFNFAKVYLAQGRDLEALEALEQFLADTRSDELDIAGHREEAGRKLADLRARVAALDVLCDVPGAEVLVDGRPAGVTPLPRPARVLPGTHEVVVRKAGYFPFSEQVDAAGGERIRVKAALVVRPAAVAGAPPAGQLETPPEEPRPPVLRTPWFWGALGAVAAGTAAVLLLTNRREGLAPCAGCAGDYPVRP